MIVQNLSSVFEARVWLETETDILVVFFLLYDELLLKRTAPFIEDCTANPSVGRSKVTAHPVLWAPSQALAMVQMQLLMVILPCDQFGW